MRPTRRCSPRSRASPSTRTSRWPISRERCWSSRARCSARGSACDCARGTSRSPSLASRWTCRVLCVTLPVAGLTARSARSARARAGSRSWARAWSTRTCSSSCATTATTLSVSRALRSAWGSSGSRCSSTGSPTCGSSSRTTSASWSSSSEGPLVKVPVTWLKAYCDPGLSAEEIGERLSLSGTELERIVRVGVPSGDGNAGFFRIGKVMSAEQHPDADRLRVCSVQLAGSDMRTIVCGARNVAPGETVLVALPGAVLPDGTRLGRAKLRGVESDGMILSETEVELGSDSQGIMVLPDSLEAGEEAGRYVTLGDDVLELEISPNRPDNLSVYGIAREVHAL